MTELPLFFKLIKQNLFLYSLLTNSALDTTYLEGFNFHQYTPNSVYIENFVLSKQEIFKTMTAGIEGKEISLSLSPDDDRFLTKTKEYFGKDSFLGIRNKDPEMKNQYTEVREKIVFLQMYGRPLVINIRSSPHFGNDLKIYTENNFIFKNHYRKMDSLKLSQLFEASTKAELEFYITNDLRGTNKMWTYAMELYEELKDRGDLGLFTDLLGHEDLNVRRWAASCILIIDEEKAVSVLQGLGTLNGFVGEEARKTLKDWQNGTSQFVF